MNCRIVVVSCPRRKPIQEIWWSCFVAAWPDCPYPVDIISPEQDIGWNANLIKHIETLSEEFILLLLDDNFLEDGPLTHNMGVVTRIMTEEPDIGMIKVQAGGCAAPEIVYQPWHRIREYDRAHHPFKRTNLMPTMFRREWLLRLSRAVLDAIGPKNDIGRCGAIEFEMTGTLLTEDAVKWPERMMGIHRPEPDGGGGDSLLSCIANDAVREGIMRPIEPLISMCKGVQGIEAFI